MELHVSPRFESLELRRERLADQLRACEVCYEFILGTWQDKAPGVAKLQLESFLFDKFKSHKCPLNKKTHTGNGAPSGAFAFTLTKSPKDDLSVNDMIKAVKKIMSQKSCPVKSYAWYLEDKGTDASGEPLHPHIHGMYETQTGGRIEKKHFMRAWSVWDEDNHIGAGHRGGYHRPVRLEEQYNDYIKKDGGIGESHI